MTRPTGTLALAFLVAAGPASALDLTPRDVHLRAGFSLNPDQFHAGVQARVGRTGRVAIRPSLDLGLGNGVILLTLNGDVLYRFERTGRLRPFLGGGPALAVVDVTDGVGEADGVEVELAGHVVGGFHWVPSKGGGGLRYLVEARAGVGDTADFKLSLGIAFW